MIPRQHQHLLTFMIINSKWLVQLCVLIPLMRSCIGTDAKQGKTGFNEIYGFAKWYESNETRGGKRVEGLCKK